jgi:hypothetical protein
MADFVEASAFPWSTGKCCERAASRASSDPTPEGKPLLVRPTPEQIP